ncbi:MAG: CAP domain-containing protein [Anaerolineae bacterium]|nr:CAP domain-containing protein [Anaerolineae bacterium]
MKSLAVMVLLVIVIGLALPVGSQAEPIESLIPEMAAELNLWRLGLGLGPLVYNPTLESMAAAQADYLVGLPSIPAGGAMHTGARGEDVRRRSQFEAFKWPTYGHPELMLVTEIAAIGNVDLAIEYWHNSDIHNRSVTNPAYREVGIAVRQLRRDVLFIVVMGGEPNVLPALADVDTGDLYLTSERAQWKGAWIGEVARYRVLDAERQPLQDWAEWQVIVDLPPEIEGDVFYVEYEDAAGKRAETEVRLNPVWSSIVVESVVPTAVAAVPTAGLAPAFPTNTPNSPANIPAFATNTPIVQPTTVAVQPTATSIPGAISLVYSSQVLTVIAQADSVNLGNISFRNGAVTFAATRWERVSSTLNVGALRRGDCLQIGLQTASNFGAPPECRQLRSLITMGQDRMFWTTGTFEVLDGETVLATCAADGGMCQVSVP